MPCNSVRKHPQLPVAFAIFALLGMLPLSTSVEAAEWYQTEPYSCDAIGGIGKLLVDTGFPLLVEKQGVDTSKRYVIVNKSTLNQLRAATGPTLLQRKTLDKQAAQRLRNYFSKFAASVEIPFLQGEIGSAAVAALFAKVSSGTGLVAGGLWSLLVDELNGRLESIVEFRTLTAEGGELIQLAALRPPEPNRVPLLYLSFHYQVVVGSEPTPRRYLLSTCVYPFEVHVEQFKTVSPLNNLEARRTDAKTFSIWSVDDQRYQKTKYIYVRQDTEHYYFRYDDGSKETRISMWGGGWQVRTVGEKAWGTFYLKTISE